MADICNKTISDLIKALKHLDLRLTKVTSVRSAGGTSVTQFERETLDTLMQLVDNKYSDLVVTLDKIKHNKVEEK
jgi:hypothetical protein